MTASFEKMTVGEVVDAVASSGSLAVICHTNPDGDTVGSASALALIARGAGVRSAVILPDEPQERLRFLLPPDGAKVGAKETDGFDLVCAVDVASPAQFGSLGELIPRVGFMIDHHGMGEPFAKNLIDPSASAAGEIVFDVYEEAVRRGAIARDPEIARRIYGAILSDTGSFAFSNVTQRTHLIAASLLEEIAADPDGMPADEINRLLFGRATEGELRAKMLTVKNLKTFADGAIAASFITAEEFAENGISERDAGGTVDVPRMLIGAEVAFVIRQSTQDPREFRVSSRSNSDFDVSAVCALFGGGGHRRAAGCNVYADSPEEAFDKVASAFENSYKAVL
ncbi:MAG: DHH family phosphoesterase [Clostridia bacterium]|nr:DHH family phosphoesterase [Clostridia bacterium]